MRTTTLKFCMLFILLLLNIGQTSYAKVDVTTLISQPTGTTPGEGAKERENVKNLPDKMAPQLVTVIIKYILRLAAILTMIGLVVTAIYYLISLGKEEDISKAKNIMIYLIIGIVIIAASYGIVTGLSQFDFFTEPSP